MKGKRYFENWYSREDPWRYINTITDKIRRAIILKHIEPIFSNGAQKTVLDAGCGEGYTTRDVAGKYNAVVDAFDISENALTTARKRNFHENICYFQLDLNDYTSEKLYDLIMCEEALYYLTEDKRISILRNFHDSIKPEGYLKVTSIIVGETSEMNYFTLDSLKELLVSNGFQLVSLWPSVIEKRNVTDKATYRLLELMNKRKLVSPGLLESLVSRTLRRPLNNCRAVSVLAKKNNNGQQAGTILK